MIQNFLRVFLGVLQLVVLGSMVFFMLVFSWGGTLQGELFEKFCLFGAFIIISISLWVLSGIIRGFVTVRITTMHPFLGLFVMCVVFSTLFSVDPSKSIWGAFEDPFTGVIGIVFLVMLFLWMSSVEMDVALYRAGMIGYIFGATILAILIVANSQGWSISVPFVGVDVGSGTTRLVLLLNIFVLLWALSWREMKGYTWWTFSQKIFAAALFIMLIVTFWALGIVFEYTLWLPIIVGIGVPTLFLIAGRLRISRKMIVALPFAVIVLGLFFAVYDHAHNQSDKFQDLSEARETQEIAWHVARSSVEDRPILGYGPGLYAYAYAKQYPTFVNETTLYGIIFPEGRGALYEYAATLGLVGVISFLLLFASYGGAIWSFLRGSREASWNTTIAFGATLAVFSVIVTEEMNGEMLFLLFFFSALTFVSVKGDGAMKVFREKRIPLRVRSQYAISAILLAAGFIVGIILLSGTLYRSALSSIYMKRAFSTPQPNEDFLLKAIELNSEEPEYRRRLVELQTARAVRYSIENPEDAVGLESQWNAAFSVGAEAKKLTATNVNVIATLAQMYEDAGSIIPDAYDLSLEEYIRAQELSPHNPLFYFKEGLVVLKQAQAASSDEVAKTKLLTRSIQAFKRALELTPSFSAAEYQLALAYKEFGDIDAAEIHMQRALAIHPLNQQYLVSLAKFYIDMDIKHERAKELLEASLAINSGDVVTNLYLGQWYSADGKKDKARESYERAKQNLGEGQEGVAKYINSLIIEEDKPSIQPEEQYPAEDETIFGDVSKTGDVSENSERGDIKSDKEQEEDADVDESVQEEENTGK